MYVCVSFISIHPLISTLTLLSHYSLTLLSYATLSHATLSLYSLTLSFFSIHPLVSLLSLGLVYVLSDVCVCVCLLVVCLT